MRADVKWALDADKRIGQTIFTALLIVCIAALACYLLSINQPLKQKPFIPDLETASQIISLEEGQSASYELAELERDCWVIVGHTDKDVMGWGEEALKHFGVPKFCIIGEGGHYELISIANPVFTPYEHYTVSYVARASNKPPSVTISVSPDDPKTVHFVFVASPADIREEDF